jgi:hypothetical protein
MSTDEPDVSREQEEKPIESNDRPPIDEGRPRFGEAAPPIEPIRPRFVGSAAAPPPIDERRPKFVGTAAAPPRSPAGLRSWLQRRRRGRNAF